MIDARASAALPNTVLLLAHSLFVCRLTPHAALQANTAFTTRQGEVSTWLPYEIT
jgi:hypothetical protein